MLDKDECGRYCGFLRIDEMDKRKHFPRRYFLLDKDNGLVKWFQDKPKGSSSGHVCGMINIGYITKVDIVTTTKLKLEYCFVINTPFRPYYAQASNKDDLEEWVEVLNDASKITVPPEALLPRSDDQQNGVESNGAFHNAVVAGVVLKKSMSNDHHHHSRKTSTGALSSATSYQKLNSSVQDIDMSGDELVKQGWGTKQGHIRKNWKRRFFKVSKCGFAYYKSDKDDEEPLRFIPIIDILFAKEDGAHHRENVMFVVTTDKIYYIQADSSSEMLSWIVAFENVIDMFRNHSGQQGSMSSLDTISQSDLTTATGGHSSSSGNSINNMDTTATPSGSQQLRSTAAGGGKKEKKVKLRNIDEKTASSSSSHHRYSVVSLMSGSDHHRRGSRNTAASFDFRRSVHTDSPSRGFRHQRLDPQVDLRSAVKPSTVKKKKNPGILFSFNTMLNRKVEKMSKQQEKTDNLKLD